MMSVQKKLLEHRHRAINKNMNVLVFYSCLSRTKAIALKCEVISFAGR